MTQMNIMKRTTFVIISILLFSCNNHLDKPIFEPLTVQELKETIDDDSTFEYTYKSIQYIKDSVLTTDIQKAKFADLTYERVHELVKLSEDTAYLNPIVERINKEWEGKYGVLHHKVDSLSNYWKAYKAQNSLEQYVKIELVELKKEYYTYSYGIKNVNLGFKLTPLKGTIEQLRFGYRIEAKINENNNGSESIRSFLDNSWCLSTSPFSVPTVRYWEANYTNEKLLESRNLETVLRDYNILIEVDEIRKDGKNMSNDELGIPESIKNHWEYEHRKHLEDLYVKDVLKELLNVDYIPDYEYQSSEISKIFKEKDPKAFDFLQKTKN